MSPRLWAGENEAAGKVSVYHGPLLLAYDTRFDAYTARSLPALQPKSFGAVSYPVPEKPFHFSPKPLVLVRLPTADKKGITLCDFASAGTTGTQYISWLPSRSPKPAPFSRRNPLRAAWPGD